MKYYKHNGQGTTEDSHTETVSALRLIKGKKELPEQLMDINTVPQKGPMYVK